MIAWRALASLLHRVLISPVRWIELMSGRDAGSRARAILLATVALFALPTLVDLLSDPVRAPFRWIAADTFYYLTVARNFARHGLLAFDGEHASNGFQPLWQLCACATECAREGLGLGRIGPWLLTLSGLGLISAALWLLGSTLERAGRLSVLFLALPVGVYALTVLPAWMIAFPGLIAHQNLNWLLPVFGTSWSYVNGMESGLVLFFFALSLWMATRADATSSPARAIGFGAALAGLALARLDHVFFSLPLLLGYAWLCFHAPRPRPRPRWQLPLLAGGACALLVLPYLLYNKHYFGSFGPLSGVAKSSFPEFSGDNLDFLLALGQGELKPNQDLWLQVVCRQAQTVIPALYASAYLLLRAFRRSREPLTVLLTASALGALVLSFYNFSFTRNWYQGYWYAPVSTLLPSLFVLNAPALHGHWRFVPRWLAALALSASVLGFFYKWHRQPTYNRDFANFALHSVGDTRAHYRGHPPKLIEIDDGIVGYSLDTPAHPFFLALDPEGFAARKRGRLLELALERGFDHVASSIYRPTDLSNAGLNRWLGWRLAQNVARFKVEAEYVSPDGLLVIAKITRAPRAKAK